MTAYTREQFAAAVDAAHDAVHRLGMADMTPAAWVHVAEAHDALHAVGAGAVRVDCATLDPEAQRLAAAWLKKLNGTGLPCGHRLADLIGGAGGVTRCGACLEERQAREVAAFQSANEQRGAVHLAVEAATRGLEKLQAQRDTAQAEVKRLRGEAETSHLVIDLLAGWFEEGDTVEGVVQRLLRERGEATEALEHLRGEIEGAPCATSCAALGGREGEPFPCTCWKGRTLGMEGGR